MKLSLAALLFAIPMLAGGCAQGKPSEASCRKAVEKIRALTGLEQSDIGADPDAMIRSCRANSSKESVKCVLAAKNLDDLEKCEGAVGKEVVEEIRQAEKQNADEESADKSDEEGAE